MTTANQNRLQKGKRSEAMGQQYSRARSINWADNSAYREFPLLLYSYYQRRVFYVR
jgi:hypothetical protein